MTSTDCGPTTARIFRRSDFCTPGVSLARRLWPVFFMSHEPVKDCIDESYDLLGKVPGRSGREDWPETASLTGAAHSFSNEDAWQHVSELQWVIAMRSMFVLSQLCSHLRVRNRGGNTMGLTLTVSFDTPFIFEE